MGWKSILFVVFTMFVIGLLIFYWFIPINFISFGDSSSNNFNPGLENVQMQFYSNMRYLDSSITYKIEDCTLSKHEDMEQAFDILEEVTDLEFVSVGLDEEISITCEGTNKLQDGLFIAGEGGPTNITKAGEFGIIYHGKILLIKDSKCPRPNIALHELLHALGFDHSSNSNNIMYNVTKCRQTIGDDIPELINELYSIPAYADLVFEDVSASMNGKYLDVEMSVRNNGLAKSGEAVVQLFSNGDEIKEFELEEIDIGYGRTIFGKNIWIPKLSVDEIEFVINSSFNELEKENNKIILKIKE